MATSKTYYYIKLKDNYFDQDNIKVLESMENGYIYSLIIIKLYLKSAKSEGKLMMTSTIPYNPNKVDILAKVINHDVSHVREAIQLGVELDLITIIDSNEIWLNDIQNFIGKASTEADRKRLYRRNLDKKQLKGQMSGQKEDKSPPEKEKEKDIELKIYKEREKDTKEKPSKKAGIVQSINSLNLSDEYKTALQEFAEHREALKAPLSQIALTKLINKLDKLASSEAGKIDLLNESIVNGWKGIFVRKVDNRNIPLKDRPYIPTSRDYQGTMTDEEMEIYNR